MGLSESRLQFLHVEKAFFQGFGFPEVENHPCLDPNVSVQHMGKSLHPQSARRTATRSYPAAASALYVELERPKLGHECWLHIPRDLVAFAAVFLVYRRY